MSAQLQHLPQPANRPDPRLPAKQSEQGASAVEFALIAILLFMLVFGIISSGFAFSRKITLNDASREGVRYGATLPVGNDAPVPNSWFDAIAARTIDSAAGDMAESWEGQYVCVAYIGYGSPLTSSTDRTRKREKSGTNPATYTDGSASNPATWCFDDGRGSNPDERRVQVVARRTTRFDVIVFGANLTLDSPAVARYETTPPS
jgi:TadE-like protein